MSLNVKIAVFAVLAFGCFSLLTPNRVQAQSEIWSRAMGWDDLLVELGTTAPDGTDVMVSQVEAPNGSGGYSPAPGNSEFLNPTKNFIDESGLNTVTSAHANDVGIRIYGNSSSLGKDVVDVFLYEANDWLNNALAFSTNGNPVPHPYDIQNHSWIANGIANNLASSILGRADYLAEEYNLNIVVGVGNAEGGNTPKLMAHGYNSLSVGKTSGEHTYQPTTFLGPGRNKPEILAFSSSTSIATGRISGLVTVMREATAGTNAENNEAIKALLLAGATKTEFTTWDQTETRPMDEIFGVGEANIYNTYKIFAAGELDGVSGNPIEFGGSEGWDFESVEAGGTRNYIIEVTEPADHMSIVLTWNRQITDGNSNANLFLPVPTLPDMDLLITGNGVSQFSQSDNHNIEHIYLRDVEPGQYFVVVFSNRDGDYSLAWRTAESSDSTVTQVQVIDGTSKGGSVLDIAFDDDATLAARPGQTTSGYVTTVEFETTTSIGMPNAIELSLDGYTNTPNLDLEFSFYSYIDEEFVAMNSLPTTTNESNFVGEVTGAEVNDFIEPGTGAIRARVTWRPSGPVTQYPWSAIIDRAVFEISQ